MNDAMRLFQDFARGRRSIFVKGDSGVLPLLQSLRQAKAGLYRSSKINQDEYENAYAVFTRFQWKGSIYAAIVEARSASDALDVYLDAQKSLHAGEARILSLVRLPTSRILPFPFFVVCDEAIQKLGGKMATNYWSNLKGDNESITTWLKDFLRYRREIVQTWAPDIEPAVPSLLSAQEVYAVYDSAGWLALRYYKGQGTGDEVKVKQAPREGPRYQQEGNAIDFKQFFADLPPEADLIGERSFWSSETEMVYRNWPHPFLEAASEVRKLINDYNSSVPRVYLDALDLTDSRLRAYPKTVSR
jgi:hypothetical protein